LQELFKEERALEIMALMPMNPSFDNILEFYFQTAMTSEEFAQLADKITTSDDETLPGLVNINTAPKEVLMCLPGLEETDADALLRYRESNKELESIAWIVDVLDRQKAIAIGSYITVRSQQVSADIVCLSGDGRAYQRYKAVFDTQSGTPKVVYWKSLTSFGWPLNREIVTALRQGEPLTGTILGMH
jgi:type II secretory pathway component PulK